MHRLLLSCFALVLFFTTAPAHAQALEDDVQVRVSGDFGGLVPLYHSIQFGSRGSDFDYVTEGGQDVVFPVGRLTAQMGIGRHRLTFLYQPLELNSQVVLRRSIVVDDLRFAEGSAVDLTYGFPFYRLSYTYDVVSSERLRVGLGGSLQVRDATITFTSADGDQRRARRDVGPVPALKGLIRYDTPSGWFTMFEVDGMYAPVKYINGGDSDVVGAIIDANLRAGYRVNDRLDTFVNLRWLGGGAEGTSEPEDFSDGYNQNWLQFLILSIGADVALL